ncbi:MAG: NTP transferase domain-containing protein, partial [Pseudomonadota bacterium]
VSEGMMVGTVKIIPYAVSEHAVEAALVPARKAGLRIAPPHIRGADVILTRTEGFADKLLTKGETVVRGRLSALGVAVETCKVVPHRTGDVAQAIANSHAGMVLLLGASATSDAADVCPAGLTEAGGTLTRFGMPVDPGNLLFLGDFGGRPVVGLPGCARSPAMNGADWVLERLVCGLPVGDDDIAGMGVGGLLKEIPVRPHPRVISAPDALRPRVEVLLLAAGAGRRMRGDDKLLRSVGGKPLLRRAAEAALASGADKVHVVLPPSAEVRAAVLDGTAVHQVIAQRAAEGMGASLSAGMQAASKADAVIVALADMPDVGTQVFDALIAAYDPEAGAEICRAVSVDGQPGHPILFGRRFFEALSEVSGDVGARDVLATAKEFTVPVTIADRSPVVDLDTPEAWAAYEAERA